MFNVGDEVRLVNGWTRMVVIEICVDGTLRTAYDHDNMQPLYRITDDTFLKPEFASGFVKRQPTSFVKWDGEPVKKVYYTMQKLRYRAKMNPKISGVLLTTTSIGHMILELDNGGVWVEAPENLERDMPFTFFVKATNNNYTCTYSLPKGQTVQIGDMLLSDTGNLYLVKEIDTQCDRPKGEFVGKRVLTQSL